MKDKLFDLFFCQKSNGWSVAYLLINNQLLEFEITHLFNNPYADSMDALAGLIKGQDTAFFWYNEPYGAKFLFTALNHNEVRMDIFYLNKVFYQVQTDDSLDLIASTVLTIRELVIMFYFQYQKLCTLMQDKEFAKGRSHYFPFQRFKEFEKQSKAYWL